MDFGFYRVDVRVRMRARSVWHSPVNMMSNVLCVGTRSIIGLLINLFTLQKPLSVKTVGTCDSSVHNRGFKYLNIKFPSWIHNILLSHPQRAWNLRVGKVFGMRFRCDLIIRVQKVHYNIIYVNFALTKGSAFGVAYFPFLFSVEMKTVFSRVAKLALSCLFSPQLLSQFFAGFSEVLSVLLVFIYVDCLNEIQSKF